MKDKALQAVMETKRRNWISWLTGSGKYVEAEFEEDLVNLRQAYLDLGYLDVEIDAESVEFDYPRKKSMTITIPIEEGEPYYLGGHSIEGMTVFTEQELLRVVRLEADEPFSPKAVNAATNAIKDYYTSPRLLEYTCSCRAYFQFGKSYDGCSFPSY